MNDKKLLAPSGSTGNNTHPGVDVGDAVGFALMFVVEAAGATPTVTYKFQGSIDGANWFDLVYLTDGVAAESAAARVRTAVGADVSFLSNAQRRYSQFRVVTSANTNVTYRAEIYRSTTV